MDNHNNPDNPCMTPIEHLVHDMFSRAANDNCAPKVTLTIEGAIAYAKYFFDQMDMDEWSVVEAKFDKDDSDLVRVYCTWNCKDGGNYVMDVWIVNNEYYGEL